MPRENYMNENHIFFLRKNEPLVRESLKRDFEGKVYKEDVMMVKLESCGLLNNLKYNREENRGFCIGQITLLQLKDEPSVEHFGVWINNPSFFTKRIFMEPYDALDLEYHLKGKTWDKRDPNVEPIGFMRYSIGSIDVDPIVDAFPSWDRAAELPTKKPELILTTSELERVLAAVKKAIGNIFKG